MCATLAATSAFLEAVNLTLGPTERVPADVKRTLSGLGGTEAVRRVGWGRWWRSRGAAWRVWAVVRRWRC